MSNLKNWLDAFEQLNKEFNPYKPHIISSLLNEHEQNSYAVLHAAFVLFSGSINKQQESLYSFWLPAISNELSLSEVINQAQELDGNKLKEFLELIEEKGMLDYFLLDVIIFAHIKGEISDEFNTIIGELFKITQVTEDQLNSIFVLSNNILRENSDEVLVFNSTTQTLLQNETWQEFYTKELNVSNINNIESGIWAVTEDLAVYDKKIEISNALVIFNNNASLVQHDGQLILANTMLINPQVRCSNTVIDFDNITVIGNYDVEEKSTAFEFTSSPQFNVKNSNFTVRNARAFLFTESQSTGLFENVIFSGCGNPNLLGGAVKYEQGLKFTNCRFEDCNAKVAGAAFLKLLTNKSFENCKFVGCTSEHEWSEGVNAGALYFEHEEQTTHGIIDCFIDNNISICMLFSPCENNDWRMLCNSIIKGSINFASYYDSSSGYSCPLDAASIIKSGATDSRSKNRKTEITAWNILVREEVA